MTYDEMNSYILDYMNNDITGRALMLSGSWGSGKSYYIKNHLKPFIESQENKKYIKKKKPKCVIVSLYGLSDISEISKALYIELRTIVKSPKLECFNSSATVGKIVGKTIFNGLINKVGFDIGCISESDFQKVYESIDLTDKLIVFEDIERTQIDLEEFLGYVNNLCENDKVKVLLITNESEIVKYNIENKPVIKDDGSKFEVPFKKYTENTTKYFLAKEKTVSDTIQFQCDYKETIKEIIKPFGVLLNTYSGDENIHIINLIFNTLKSYNLRAFIYGCQKAKKILEYIDENKIRINDEIKDIVFYGIIAFTQRQTQGIDLCFSKNLYVSSDLGLNEETPLFRFCYDYINYQELSVEKIEKSIKYYEEYRLKGKWNSGRDEDLKTVKNFYISSYDDVARSIMNLPDKIRKGDIPYCDYGVLLNCLVAIKYDAEIDIHYDTIEATIIENLKKSRNDLEFEELFVSGYELKSKLGRDEYDRIKQEIWDLFNLSYIKDFPYCEEKIIDYYNQNIEKLKENIDTIGFVHTINIDRFIYMLKQCTALEISTIRNLFMDLYRDREKNEIMGEDIFALNKLCDKLPSLLEYDGYDKIQQYQIKWLVKNISDIVISFA